LPGRALLLILMILISAISLHAADSVLIAAVKKSDSAAVRRLLEQGAVVNSAGTDGTTALHWAVESDNPEVTRMLLKAGADAKVANRYGMTPLHLAAVNGNTAVIRDLLDAGADVNAVLPEGETVLMTAARTGSAESVKLLLERGANVDAREKWFGESALMWAAAEDHGNAVSVLVAHGAPVDSRSTLQKITNRNAGQSMLSLGNWTPLMYAARENALDAGRALVKGGAGLNLTDPDGATALVIAIINANYEFAALLLDAGADPNIVDNEAGMGALYAVVDMHRLAVGHGRPNPQPVGLMTAVDLAKKLLDHEADPNRRLKKPILKRHHTAGDSALGDGATPFLRAAKSGDQISMSSWLKMTISPWLAINPRLYPSHIDFASGTRMTSNGSLPRALRYCSTTASKRALLMLQITMEIIAAPAFCEVPPKESTRPQRRSQEVRRHQPAQG